MRTRAPKPPLDPGCSIAAVPRHAAVAYDEKEKPFTIPDGCVVQIASMTAVGKNDTLFIVTRQGRKMSVQSRDFNWYVGQVPDFTVKYYLVGYGYQADYFDGINPTLTECRDLGGTYRIKKLVKVLFELAQEMTEKFRKEGWA